MLLGQRYELFLQRTKGYSHFSPAKTLFSSSRHGKKQPAGNTKQHHTPPRRQLTLRCHRLRRTPPCLLSTTGMPAACSLLRHTTRGGGVHTTPTLEKTLSTFVFSKVPTVFSKVLSVFPKVPSVFLQQARGEKRLCRLLYIE